MRHTRPASRCWTNLTGVAALAAVVFTLAPTSALAIPAWARRNGVDCSACHAGGGWKLTRMGQDFLRYGHAFKGDKAEGSFGDYNSFAYKFRFTGGDKKLETFEQHAFSIYTGGPLGEGFSYFAELYFHENSGRTSGASDFGDYARSKLAEAFLQYTRGTDKKFLSVRAGQILPQLLHIHNIGARTSGGRPNLWTKASINAGNTYQAFSRQYGIDVSYTTAGITGAAGLLNGTGTTFNVIDNNQAKDVFASVDYTFGGDGSNFGVLYYRGRYPVSDSTGRFSYSDDYWRVAAVGDYSREHFNVKAAYLRGCDETTAAGATADGQGLYVETFVWPLQKAGLFARYERWDPSMDLAGDHSDGVTAGFTWRMFTFGRLVADVSKFGRPDKKELAYTLEYNFMW